MSVDRETVGGTPGIPVKKKFETNLFAVVFANPPYYFTSSLTFGSSVISRRHQDAVDRHGHIGSGRSGGSSNSFLEQTRFAKPTFKEAAPSAEHVSLQKAFLQANLRLELRKFVLQPFRSGCRLRKI